MADAGGRIELTGLTKRFDEVTAIDTVNLTVPAGSYCCLLGPSGCGKTTLLRVIAGHETPDAGDVRIDGLSILGLPARQRPTAMMFQSYALFPHLHCLDNVAFGLRMRGVAKAERRRRAVEMLAFVRMEDFARRMPAQLSGGQRQRIALARALITEPKVVLLDEPLSALDEFFRVQMRVELRQLQRRIGITFVHVTHTNTEAIATSDLVVVMDQGVVVQADSPLDVYDKPRSPYVARFVGGHNVMAGEVRARRADGLLMVGPGEALLWAPNADGAGGDSGTACLAVRKDRLRLARHDDGVPEDDAAGRLKSRVRTIEYEGAMFKVTLEAAGGETLVSLVRDREFIAAGIEAGATVTAWWRREDVHLLEGDA